MELPPARAKQVREMIGLELQRLLEREGLPAGLMSGEIPSISVPELQLAGSHSDLRLAGNIAKRILQAMKGIG